MLSLTSVTLLMCVLLCCISCELKKTTINTFKMVMMTSIKSREAKVQIKNRTCVGVAGCQGSFAKERQLAKLRLDMAERRVTGAAHLMRGAGRPLTCLSFITKNIFFLNRSVAVISCGNKTNFQTVQKNTCNCLNPDVAAACHSAEKHANVYLPDDRRPRRDDSEALAPREFGSNLFFLFFFFFSSGLINTCPLDIKHCCVRLCTA